MSATLQAPQEPEDPASQGRLRLPPVHGGVVRPQAQPVATAEGGHLLAEEEEKGIEAERDPHSPDVGQVHGGLHLQRKGRQEEKGKARGGSRNMPAGQMEPPRRPRRSSLSASHLDTISPPGVGTPFPYRPPRGPVGAFKVTGCSTFWL